MARKKKKLQIPPGFIKYTLITVAILGVCFGVYKGVAVIMTESAFFKVKSVIVDPSLQFINRNDLIRLEGKNIFLIDLKNFEKKLNVKYPQVSHLKIVKRFPNQIIIAAKKRLPVAQILIDDKYYILDSNGVVMKVSDELEKKISNILGSKISRLSPVLGLPINSDRVNIVINIVNVFNAKKELMSYFINSADVSDLSKIKLVLNNDLEVFVDKDKVSDNMRKLSLILSQRQIDFDEVKYLDLRFKEPILGKK